MLHLLPLVRPLTLRQVRTIRQLGELDDGYDVASGSAFHGLEYAGECEVPSVPEEDLTIYAGRGIKVFRRLYGAHGAVLEKRR